jgi:hypothetical protein
LYSRASFGSLLLSILLRWPDFFIACFPFIIQYKCLIIFVLLRFQFVLILFTH